MEEGEEEGRRTRNGERKVEGEKVEKSRNTEGRGKGERRREEEGCECNRRRGRDKKETREKRS